MKVYNTLSRKVEEFQPIDPLLVKLYTCGPTVYDYAHIGNLRSFVFDDTLRRVLEANGFKVKHIMNITDVGHLSSDMDEGEDKLETGARREEKSVWDVAEHYIDAFIKDMSALNVLKPNGYNGPKGPYARATEFISQQQEIIRLLIDKGVAYQTQQAIYFDISKISDYGKLTGQKLSDKEIAARQEVVTDSDKRNPQDFALWFFATGRFANHSMRWPSPWGEGFPGWHLECSTIIHSTLVEPIDIHTGGVDHIGTHHTNEIAQTEAAFDVELAKYWLHNEHLLVDGQKMSKSLGNFVTLKDLTEKGYDPLALRLFFLQSHYRTQSNFTWGALSTAATNLIELRAMADMRWQTDPGATPLSKDFFDASQKDILDSLSDDLATPAALSKLFQLADRVLGNGLHPQILPDFIDFLTFLDQVLGLGFLDSKDITDEQKDLIRQRWQAREKKDWQDADKIRQALKIDGLELLDGPRQTLWRRSKS